MLARCGKLWACVALIGLALAAGRFGPAIAQQVVPRALTGAWTLDEARDHLRFHPRDAYVQYLALQLARREGKLAEVAAEIGRRNPRWNQWNQRRDQVELFSIFSGALAVQESLQLDALAPEESAVSPQEPNIRRGPRPIGQRNRAAPAAAPQASTVDVSSLTGPTIKSHPWQKMLAGRSPTVSGLALSVPADFYFVSFRSVNKLIEATELSSLWGAHLLNQANHEAQTQLVGDRLQEQLAVEVSPALRPFYDAMVAEVAVVGSDLFLREGSDATMLFKVTQPALFRAKMDEFLIVAENSRDDVTRTTGEYGGTEYVHLATPDRRIHVYSAYPSPELHVRGTSLPAFERVLDAIAGVAPEGARVERLGETDEFRYVRTLMPEGASEEDGFVYLSDPFVRHLMNPSLRLTERRRMSCYNHLRMAGHAGLMHLTQTDKAAQTLDDLKASDCIPGEFGTGKFVCPDGGEYTFGDDGLTCVCSHHGYASYLTPCSEIETTRVTEPEAEAYRQFVQRYNGFWRQFFDPIAIRLHITPERYRAETIVLPLIDNSIYTALSRALGGPPEPLDALPVPKRNIFSFAVRVNKAQILHDMGLEQFIRPEDPNNPRMQQEAEAAQASLSMRQIALAMLNHESARKSFPAASRGDLSWRVELLPYLGQGELYNEFHRDEPWDSEHNRKLIARMPEVYASGDAELTKAGKTRFVVPRGAGTLFADGNRDPQLRGITDGTSNTILLLEADDPHAVVWTKPDDIELAANGARRKLKLREPSAFFASMCDGSLVFLRDEIQPEALAGMLTAAGDDGRDWQSFGIAPPNVNPGRRHSAEDMAVLHELRLGELITKGVGNQVAFHVYDSEPMFDLSLAQLIGGAVGSFRGGGMISDDFLFIVPLVSALNGPVYASIPVQDAKIVDDFLGRLDKFLVELAAREEGLGWFRIEQDFYHLNDSADGSVRSYGLRFGPLKWRFSWSRIGDAIYIASNREILDDLAALPASAGKTPVASSSAGAAQAAHGMVRLRPQHWDRVLAAYRLAWEENSRQSCLKNLGPLSSLARAVASSHGHDGSATLGELAEYAARIYDVHHFCPDGGAYHTAADGRSVECSIHGTVREPRQPAAPAAASELGQLLRQFRDLTVMLTFLDDGLHAVVTLDRIATKQ
jgi:hypothetical protein